MADQTLEPNVSSGNIDANEIVSTLSNLMSQEEQPSVVPQEDTFPIQPSETEQPIEPFNEDAALPMQTSMPAPLNDELPKYKTIYFEDKAFEVPEKADETFIFQAIKDYTSTPEYAAKKAATDPAFVQTIDTESGAPISVSVVVGPSGDLSQAERLATLKNYYPDAAYYGEDNFIFTDPDTKKLTLYNAPGFDIRDVSEYGKVITETVGGTLGGIMGVTSSLATGPGAVVSAPTLGLLGVGVGTEIGARLFDTTMGLFAGRVRTQKTVVEEFTETGAKMALAIGGQKAGELIAVGGKRVLIGGKQSAADLVAKFGDLNIDIVGAAVGSKGMLGRMGAGFEQMAAAGPIIQKQAEKVIVQLDDALERIGSKMGVIRTPEQAGKALKESAIAAEKRVKDKFSQEYTEIFEEIGPDSVVERLPSVFEELQPYLRQIADLPAEAQPEGKILTLVKKWGALNEYAETGNLTFAMLRDLRTNLRGIKNSSKKSGTLGDFDELVNNIYKGLTADLSEAASKASPNLGNKLKALDKKRFEFADTAQKTLDNIKKYDADNGAFQYILTAAKGGGKEGSKALQRLRENFTPEEWGDVAASTLHSLGRENVGAQVGQGAEFSVSTFMKRIAEIKKNGPEAMESLFGGTQFAEVADDLLKFVDVVGSLKEVKRFQNVSNTAGALNQMVFWGSLVDAGRSVVTGNIGEAALLVTGTVVAPVVAAKLMTNSAVVKWLSTPATEISKDVVGHMGRLAALAVSEPEIQEEIRQYYKAIRSYTGYNEENNQGTAK